MYLLFSSEQAVIQYKMKMQILNNKKCNKEEIKNNDDNINSNAKPSLFGNYKMSEAKSGSKSGSGDMSVSMSSCQGSNKMNME